MPWRTLCGFPPTKENITLRVPNGAWRPDTVITDWDGNEIFVLLDQSNEMRSFEAVFGDLEAHRLVCVKRHLMKAFWKDGFYFCTYRPNYPGQKPLEDRDMDNKKVYPFSYLQIVSMKGRFYYRYFDKKGLTGGIRLWAENPWLGFMNVCCTPFMRCGRFTARFKKGEHSKTTTVTIDQWRNVVDVGPNNDLLASLCMAYVFDRWQNQPMVTTFGRDDDDIHGEQPDDGASIDSQEQQQRDLDSEQPGAIELTNMPSEDDPVGGSKNQPDEKKKKKRRLRGLRRKKKKEETLALPAPEADDGEPAGLV